jgi:L-ribulose-5-phosphate 3-epimerase
MKKGINAWSFPAGYTIAECIHLAKNAGFSGIELALTETGELSLESSDLEIAEIKKIAADIQIEITSLASGLLWNYSLTSNNPDNRKKAKEIVAKQLEFAAKLKASTILVIPGAVGVDFIPDTEVVEYDLAYDYALEGIKELAVIAERHQVHIGLENVWNKFLLSPLEMRNFIDEVNSPYVGAYFDVGNAVLTGYPEHWVKILGKRIKKVHFKDYRRQAAGLAGFVDLLAGDVNYPAVIEALDLASYDGYVIAEMIPPYQHHAEQFIYNTSKSMDAILGRKRESV